MDLSYRVTRYLDNGDTNKRQVVISPKENLMVTELKIEQVLEFITPKFLSNPYWSDVFDINQCFEAHALVLDDHIGDLKREAMSVRMRTGNKKNLATQNDIALNHQVYVLGILDNEKEYMARKEVGGPGFLVSANLAPAPKVGIELESKKDFPEVSANLFAASTSNMAEKEVRDRKPSRRGRKPKKRSRKDMEAAEAEEYRSFMAQTKNGDDDGSDSGGYQDPSERSRRCSTSSFIPPASRQEERVWRCIACGRAFPDQTQIAIHVIAEHVSNDEVSSEQSNELKPLIGSTGAGGQVVKMEAGCDVDENELMLRRVEMVDTYSEEISASCLLQCEFCESVFVEISALFVHAMRHSRAERNYECLNCNREFSSHGQAIAHWQAECAYTRSGSTFDLHKYLACNICERKFVGWEQLYNHRYKNRHLMTKFYGPMDEEVHQCDQCSHISPNFQTLMDHRAKQHPRSLRAAELAKRNHGQRSFLCEICGKAYTQSSHLWQHLRFHQGIKPFACTVPGCGRRFTIRPDLNDHVRKSHTGERPFHCTECDKRFLTGSVYYQHRLIHRGDRRYACPQCEKRFYRADALKNHARIHSGEKPYRCPVCDRCFRQRGDRDKHLKVRHGHLEDDKDGIIGVVGAGLGVGGHSSDDQQMEQHMYIRNVTPSMFPNVGRMYQSIEVDEKPTPKMLKLSKCLK